MQIPIENIYYLLGYAWNKLDEKERVNVSVDDQTELVDLFAKILINGTKILLKRGIDKSYVDYTDAIAGVKGKVQLSETIKHNLLFKQQTICTFDIFSSDILINRILLSTINSLQKTKGLDKELRKQLFTLQRMLPGIEMIGINSALFNKIRLNRNNRFYAFLMNVCQVIYENTLPTEVPGSYHFTDFTRNERKMNQLFEAFIRNFYRIEQSRYNIVKKETIDWQFDCGDADSYKFVPKMETDITLENKEEKIIIDAKYYRETMTVNYDREKIKSNNLYQLFSYLLNQEDATTKTINSRGILLYPTIVTDYNLKYQYKSHSIEIVTVNLNVNWKQISRRLLEIVQ